MALPVLSDLEFNADDVATAVANKLATENSNLGTLLQSAQDDHDDIEALKTSAQQDHDAIEDFLDITNVKRQHYTSFLNSWSEWNIQSESSYEQGLTVQNMGPLWIVNASIEKANVSGSGYEIILNIANEFTSPGGIVYLGGQHISRSNTDDFTSMIEINDSGNITVYYNNITGTTHGVFGTFIGLDFS
jgi:hypothetical protein